MGMRIARAARPRRARPAGRPNAKGATGRVGDREHTTAVRRLAGELGVEAGDLLGAQLLHDVFHRVLAARAAAEGVHPAETARTALDRAPDTPDLPGTLRAFDTAFPVEPALAQPEGAGAERGSRSPAGLGLEELALLRASATNPALRGLRSLFDEAQLAGTDYERLVVALEPGPRGRGKNPTRSGAAGLLAILREPEASDGGSLAEQLRWIQRNWSAVLTPALRRRLTLALDVLAEETRARELRDHGAHFGGDAAGGEAPELGLEGEERFSADEAWMPRVVLLAKNTFVWLEQLSRQYGRWVRRLDEIPEEELALMAQRGITGLWLIGLWQRSRASRRIKELMGNPDAAASAYAIDEYRIADELGGEDALAVLRERAWRHEVRMASDMVPNHMGIDSTWVLEHPERFIGLDHPPFPNYRFTGPDLSPDGRVGIYLENGYWDRTDAAVVFRREDRIEGRDRYIYHGNDGTSMPWNDTAQLDYLQAEVREAVIRVILDVAHRFPIIRFDAAMTLARRHIQRLWYPPPGHGGAIPSRAEYGSLSPAASRRRMSQEFWREVVDRVAAEAPGTLLLAEAFWLMEGYFVRTLGMHRVYNSAFMHMLRDERNAEYRGVLRETLAYDPRVLERYVNFMSNPDEETAAEQFGTGGKYAGVATLLATLPGLPLLGHGQLEGYRERYGMEFRKPLLDERPDPDLAALHDARLYPLLRRRGQFAPAMSFRLFDALRDDGGVLDDVFAYSNFADGERSMVLYHNRWAEVAGRIHESAPFAVRVPGGSSDRKTDSVAHALDLSADPDVWYACRELVGRREHLFEGAALHRDGLRFWLEAFGCRVYVDWRELRDDGGALRRLADELQGGGVADLDVALAARAAPVQHSDTEPLSPKTRPRSRKARSASTSSARGRRKQARRPPASSP